MAHLTSSLSSHQGFHTTVSTSLHIPSSEWPKPPLTSPASSCTLHLNFELPEHVFVDPYELHHYSEYYSFRLYGASNLEAPVFAVKENAPVLLVTPVLGKGNSTAREDEDVEFDVPLHLRYGVPSIGSSDSEGVDDGMITVSIPSPTAFWACERETGDSNSEHLSTRPEVLRNSPLIAQSFPDPSTALILFSPSSPLPISLTIRIPVGHMQDRGSVEAVTVLVVLFSFVYVGWRALRTTKRLDESVSVSKAKMD
ncbi:uncharacterized protein STEHIDRAFT_86837 [Stereum hirsutum FP-91666 SS1]|uniref:uncharacterized protein n=1 Tax=Stereum hirsutum (strain FP-91666) TaxID=721885 RepID=UPI000444956D|nr:uncharacterized protein STEHIDRAFT_86837 [Stereum hirsutum FP-91666 SS1]EIM80615.1 hypothetical protein STEHIDRAFT_86837 [Stereum hirsutum FP-91666 SS1]